MGFQQIRICYSSLSNKPVMRMATTLRTVSHERRDLMFPFFLILGFVVFAIVSGIAGILLQAMFGLVVVFVVWGLIFKSMTS